jgi:FAD-linked oxidoreductase
VSARRFRNWSGLVECTPANWLHARDLGAVVRAVRGAGSGPLRVAGSGHSFSDLVKTDGTLLQLDPAAAVLDVDPVAREASVWAGATLRQLGPALAAHGLAMENLGDIDAQSLAGAIATGTHGTGITLGNLSSQVVGLTLVSAEGDVIECSETREREVFKAAQVSLGALGVIAQVRLRLLPAYSLHEVKATAGLADTLSRLSELRAANRHFEFFWFPHTDTVQLKRLNPTDRPERGLGPAAFLNVIVLENAAFGLLSAACRVWPALSAPVSRLCARLASGGERVGPSHRIFATPRLVRFQEMEYALPLERGADALGEIRDWYRERRFRNHFPVEFRCVRGDDIPLSPAHGRDSAYIAVHVYRGMEFQRYFDAMEAILRGHGGRPHWGKLHQLSARDLAPLYPQWQDFQQVRKRLDPRGLLSTPYLARILGD